MTKPLIDSNGKYNIRDWVGMQLGWRFKDGSAIPTINPSFKPGFLVCTSRNKRLDSTIAEEAVEMKSGDIAVILDIESNGTVTLLFNGFKGKTGFAGLFGLAKEVYPGYDNRWLSGEEETEDKNR